MDEFPILVCGLGRCGTSLVMGMLDRGGVPVFCDSRASYESHELESPCDMRLILHQLAGKAAKVLDPHLFLWPERFNARVIWIDRDPREQAKSQVKFIRLVGGLDVPGQAWRAMAKGIVSDRRECLHLFAETGVEVLFLRFENILMLPDRAVEDIARFLGRRLNMEAMKRFVIPRSTKCAEDCSIELAASVAEDIHHV